MVKLKFLAFIVACAISYTANAEESWMYPLAIPSSPTQNEMDSLTQRLSYEETHGVRIFDSTSRSIHAEVASFKEIVKWYADKLGNADLSKALDSFTTSTAAAPQSRNGFSRILDSGARAHLVYRFTSDYKQITILHSVNGGDNVAISLLGTKQETSIQIVRRHANPAGR